MIKHLRFILILHLCAISMANGQELAELHRQLQHASHDSARVRLYMQLADAYYIKGHTDSSFSFINKGIALSQKIKLPTYNADFYRLSGLNYRLRQKPDAAIWFLLKSKAIATQLHQNAQIEKAGYGLAVAYGDKGDYKNCIKHIFENLAFAKKTNSTLRLNANYVLMAYLNAQYGNDSLAAYYTRKSWELDRTNRTDKQKQDEAKPLMLSDSIGIYLKRGQRQLADKLLEDFLKSGSSANTSHNTYIGILLQLAQKYADYNYNEKSLDLFNHLIMLTLKGPDDKTEYLQHSVYPLITKLYLKQNKLPEAVFWHNKSRALIDKNALLKNPFTESKMIDILRNESIILEKRGSYKKALAALHTLDAIQWHLTQKKKEIELLQITVLGDLEAEQRQVQSLNDRIKIQALMQENEKRKNSFLLILVIVLLVSGITISIFLRDIIKKHKLVIAQKIKIEAQSVQLEDANQIKDKLFSIIGHDLRSPVADLLAALEMANSLKPTKMKQYVNRMQDKIQFLYNTIDNLLNWSVTHLNPRQAPLKLINFKEAIGQTIFLLEAGAIKKNITIINQVEDTSGYTTEIQLQVILRNILGNAIKFTPTDGFIKVYSIYETEWIGISIRDSGQGMEKDIIENIHNYLESKPGTAGEKGTGLGLRLSKELIEKQGGMIKIKSQPGVGTIVELYFKRELNSSHSSLEKIDIV